MTTFADYLPRLLVGPLAGPWGLAFARAVGSALDAPGEAILDAGLLRGPLDAPDDALPHLGRDRDLPPMQGETAASHRGRLVGAWETWTWSTTNRSVRAAVRLLGYRGVRVVPHRAWPIDGSGLWARYRVYVTGHATVGELAVPFEVGSTGHGPAVGPRTIPFRVGGGATVGTSLTSTQVAALRAELRKWQAARDACHSVVFTRGGAIVGAMRVGHATVGPGSLRIGGNPNFTSIP